MSYVVGVYNCYRIIGTRPSPAVSFAWIFLHILVPVVAIVAYAVIGQNRLKEQKVIKSKDTVLDLEGSIATESLPSINPDSEQEISNNLKLVKSFTTIFTKISPYCFPSYNHAELLVDGEQTFTSIFSSLENAKSYILIQYYILRSDRLGRELQELLIKRARDGIKIYVLYDSFGSLWLSQKYVRDLRKAGVKVARFLPIASFKSFFNINFRNHRKLVIVDGQYAFTGGLNVGEEYISQFMRSKARAYSHWRDTHIKIEGKAVAQLERLFFEDWHFTTTKIPQVHRPEKLQYDSKPLETMLQVVPSGPTDLFHVGSLLFMHTIKSAQYRLWIATPYFVPDQTLLSCIELAILRGVDVRLLIPGKADHRFVHWATLSFAEQAAAKGVKVSQYQDGFMHQKVILVDDDMAIIGTTNFDLRALYLNFETNILIFNKKIVTMARSMLEDDFTHSTPLRSESGFLSSLTRLRGDLVRLIAPLL